VKQESPGIWSKLPLALVALAMPGCEPHWAGATRVPNPVLLGPVDRIGGHRAEPASPIGAVDDEISAFVATSTTEHREGDYIVRETRTYSSFDGSAKWSSAILKVTGGNKAVDVRVEGVDVGSYVFLTPGSGMSDKWIRLRGDAVRPSSAQ
jgi:hypothetical protein